MDQTAINTPVKQKHNMVEMTEEIVLYTKSQTAFASESNLCSSKQRNLIDRIMTHGIPFLCFKNGVKKHYMLDHPNCYHRE